MIRDFTSIAGIRQAQKWSVLQPNAQNDWINHRDPAFERFLALGDKRASGEVVAFAGYAMGVATNRDAWCYNFGRPALNMSVRSWSEFYDDQLQKSHVQFA